jgi:hypothetical protein
MTGTILIKMWVLYLDSHVKTKADVSILLVFTAADSGVDSKLIIIRRGSILPVFVQMFSEDYEDDNVFHFTVCHN